MAKHFKHTKHLKIAVFLHVIVVPVLLVGSDLIIGIFGHYRGSTEEFTIESMMNYLLHPNLIDLGVVLAFAFIILIVVEAVVKYRIKHHVATR